MKKVYLIFSFIILLKIINAQVLFDIEKLAQSESKSFKSLQNKDNIHALAYGFDIKYHDLYFEIDPSEIKIKGIVKSIIKIQLEKDSVIRFDCAKDLNVDSVKRNSTHLYYYQTDSNELVIQLGSAKIKGLLDTFEIYYHGIPNSNGFGSFSQTFHNGIPNLWTLSEPYGSRDWWPCKQSLDDKIDSIDIHIKIPLNNLAASNGTLEKIDTFTDGYLFNWKHRYPIATYLVALSVTNYTPIDLTIYFDQDSLQYLNYVYPENFVEALDGSLTNIQVMKLYNRLFTPYPFMKEKYGHAQFGWGGGMEHQTMSFVTNFNFELLAHELAHQWFGDKVTCGSWQDIWLNEGFATYLSGLCYENLLDGYYWPIFKKQLINKVCSQPAGSVFIPSPIYPEVARVFDNRLTYLKGAMVLHMLRWKIGDEAFFNGIKNYLNHPKLQYSFSTSQDFINEMELASGSSLTEYFNDWLYGEGYPTYTINWKQSMVSDSIILKIGQTTSSTQVPFFEMPVPIKFFNKTNEKTIVFDNSINDQFYRFDLGFKADSAILDPDMWLVQKGSSINNISTDLLEDELSILNVSDIISDELKIDISTIKNENIIIYLSNVSGQKILEEQYEVSFGKNTKIYNTSKLSKGYYILNIIAGKEKHSYKILKD